MSSERKLAQYDMQERGLSEQGIVEIISQGFGGRKPLLVVN